jgi:hypothetical protein
LGIIDKLPSVTDSLHEPFLANTANTSISLPRAFLDINPMAFRNELALNDLAPGRVRAGLAANMLVEQPFGRLALHDE